MKNDKKQIGQDLVIRLFFFECVLCLDKQRELIDGFGGLLFYYELDSFALLICWEPLRSDVLFISYLL